MRIITNLLTFFVFITYSFQTCINSTQKYASINCSRFLKCVDGEWHSFSCPFYQSFDIIAQKCSVRSKCRMKRAPGVLDYGFLSSSNFGIKRIQHTGTVVHSSIHHGHITPYTFDQAGNDDNDRSGSTTYKKFRYSTRTINGEAKTTLWYYNSNGPNYKFTIHGELPAPKEDMIEWLEKNSQFYKTTSVPYLGDTPEESKPSRPTYIPPQVVKPTQQPLYDKPTFHEPYFHEEIQKPVKHIEPKKQSTPKPVIIDEKPTEDIFPSDCGYFGKSLTNILKDKIVNGETAEIEANPWQVAIMDKHTKSLRCGGSIISKNHVLTAAHCFVSQRRVTGSNGKRKKTENVLPKTDRIIYAGNENINEPLQELTILEIYIHSKYSTVHKRNDIALILIDGDFKWSSKIYPICLPSKKANYDTQRTCRISGWGKRASEISSTEDNLLAADVKIVDTSDCKRENEKHLNISRGMFCAGDYEKGSVDSCQGDSGGPCTCNENDRGTLFGITSWGIGCGRAKYPGVYVKVALYLNWIKDRAELSIGGTSRDFEEDRDIGGPDDDENEDDDEEDII